MNDRRDAEEDGGGEGRGGDDVPPDPRRRVLRWVAFAIAAPVVTMFVLIMYFMIQTELAHDDATCPFEPVASRELDSGDVVRDERRVCQPNVEEHRYVLVRDGGDEHELGRRRLAADRFAEDRYNWVADEGERGAHVLIQNEGVEDAHFYATPGTRPH